MASLTIEEGFAILEKPIEECNLESSSPEFIPKTSTTLIIQDEEDEEKNEKEEEEEEAEPEEEECPHPHIGFYSNESLSYFAGIRMKVVRCYECNLVWLQEKKKQ